MSLRLFESFSSRFANRESQAGPGIANLTNFDKIFLTKLPDMPDRCRSINFAGLPLHFDLSPVTRHKFK